MVPQYKDIKNIIHPTASTVAAFLNGYHVDQAFGFNFKYDHPKIPIYGYNDTKFSKVAPSKKIVQGILVTNATHPSYLFTALSKKKQERHKRTESLSKYESVDKYAYKFASELPNALTPEDKASRAAALANLLRGSSFFDFNRTQKIKEVLTPSNEAFVGQNATVDLFPEGLDNNGHMLDIYYHDPDQVLWYVSFSEVAFTEVSQNISQAGAEGSSEPLYCIYQFIAKDVLIREKSIVIETPEEKIPETGIEDGQSYPVVRVIDGDTIVVQVGQQPKTVRFRFIDAPETAKSNIPSQPFADDAKEYVERLCLNKKVFLLAAGTGGYGRDLAEVIVDETGTNINKELVKNGLAWFNSRFETESPPDAVEVYRTLEEEARSSSRGIWSLTEPQIPPWIYREENKQR